MKRFFKLLPLLVAFVLVGCPDSVIPVEAVTLDKPELLMNVGEDVFLTATVQPENATDKTIVWSSSDEKVVKVDQSGKVTALGKGNAVITASVNGGTLKAESNVTVNVPLTGLTLDRETYSLELGTTVKLNVSADDGAELPALKWTSDNEEAAVVDNTGMVEGKGVGSAEITVSTEDGKYSAGMTVTVYEAATGISIKIGTESAEGTVIPAGKSVELSIETIPAGSEAFNVVWTSSNEEILAVDGNGRVTGVFGGNANVTATVEESGITASCNIQVEGFVRIPDIEIMSGMLERISLVHVPEVSFANDVTVEVLDDSCVNSSVEYSRKVITDEHGQVVGVEYEPILCVVGRTAGNTSITLKYRNSVQTVDVCVSPYVAENLSWQENEISVDIGEDVDLRYNLKVVPESWTFPVGYFEFYSTNPNFKVDNSGILKIDSNAAASETTEITVSCGDKVSEPLLVRLNPLPTSINVTVPEVVFYHEIRNIPLDFEILPLDATQSITVVSDTDMVSYNSSTRELALDDDFSELARTITLEIASEVNPDVKKEVKIDLYGFDIAQYGNSGNGLQLTADRKYSRAPETVVIPNNLNGKPIECIRYLNMSDLKDLGVRRIVLPDTLMEVGNFEQADGTIEVEFSNSPDWAGLKKVSRMADNKLINLKLDASAVIDLGALCNTGLTELAIPDGTELKRNCLADNPFEKIYVGSMLRLASWSDTVFGNSDGFVVYTKVASEDELSLRELLNKENVQIFYNASIEDYVKNDIKPIESVSFSCDKTEWRPKEFSFVEYEINPKYYFKENIEFTIENTEVAEISFHTPDICRLNVTAKSVGNTRLVVKGQDGRELGSFTINVL